MRVALPHIGNAWVAFKGGFDYLGCRNLVTPPFNSRRTLDLGVKYSPEGVCIPYKITLGNLIEACEMGADTLLQVSGHGICRLGYYASLQEKTLHDLGYKIKMANFDASGNKLKSIMEIFREAADNAPWRDLARAFLFAMAKLNACDALEKHVQKTRPRTLDRHAPNRLYREGIGLLDQARNRRELGEGLRQTKKKLDALERDPRRVNPLKVGMAGEIYVLLEPFATMDLEAELGKLGVEVHRALFLSRWTTRGFYINWLGIDEWKAEHDAARPYLKRDIGGDGWESVGEKVLHYKDYDGMVHVAPFTCMPETVAESILPTTKEELPVLSLLFDEQTARPGMLTRVEAFTDLLAFRRKRLHN
jgi:predicted nucleotide-binding protein (sugar kinase/HSP70/actin superfamily)